MIIMRMYINKQNNHTRPNLVNGSFGLGYILDHCRWKECDERRAIIGTMSVSEQKRRRYV